VRDAIRYWESFLRHHDYDRNFADWDKSKGCEALLNKGNIAGGGVVTIVGAVMENPIEIWQSVVQKIKPEAKVLNVVYRDDCGSKGCEDGTTNP